MERLKIGDNTFFIRRCLREKDEVFVDIIAGVIVSTNGNIFTIHSDNGENYDVASKYCFRTLGEACIP